MAAAEAIKIFCRLRPTKQPSGFIAVGEREDSGGKRKSGSRKTKVASLAFDLPVADKTHHGYEHTGINSSKAQHLFAFDGIFGADASQAEVFEDVGRPLVDSALAGFNGTIFAYGQTGSGKTYTTTGGAERYDDRGLIPRAIAYLFAQCEARVDAFSYSVHCSYLEIYNECGYDLLDTGRAAAADGPGGGGGSQKHGLEGLKKLRYHHDSSSSSSAAEAAAAAGDMGGYVHGLSVHHAANAEAALDLLFLGDTKRAVSSTAMNSVSSRSHAIFTLSLEARPGAGAVAVAACGGDGDGMLSANVVRRSKLHVVDLAGSERVGKSNVGAGRQLTEATYINKSLHFLEMVIVALQERSKKGSDSRGGGGGGGGGGGSQHHVPYRNSMMTSVLRDSLGGNCKTAMVATINARAVHTGESISTCRFAQRVAQVKNVAAVNECVDPSVLIAKLREENAKLRSGCGGDGGDNPGPEGGAGGKTPLSMRLSAEEENELRAAVMAYVAHPLPEPPRLDLHLGHGPGWRPSGAWARARQAMGMLRSVAKRALRGGGVGGMSGGSSEALAAAAAGGGADMAEVAGAGSASAGAMRRTAAVLQQKQTQLAAACRHSLALLVWNRRQQLATTTTAPTTTTTTAEAAAAGGDAHPLADADVAWSQFNAASDALVTCPGADNFASDGAGGGVAESLAAERASERERQEQRRRLGTLTAQARAAADDVNGARARIAELKAAVERSRVRRALGDLGDYDEEEEEEEEEEEGKEEEEEEMAVAAVAAGDESGGGGCEDERVMLLELDEQKRAYRRAYDALRERKAEIEAVRRAAARRAERAAARRRADFAAWVGVMRSCGCAPGGYDGGEGGTPKAPAEDAAAQAVGRWGCGGAAVAEAWAAAGAPGDARAAVAERRQQQQQQQQQQQRSASRSSRRAPAAGDRGCVPLVTNMLPPSVRAALSTAGKENHYQPPLDALHQAVRTMDKPAPPRAEQLRLALRDQYSLAKSAAAEVGAARDAIKQLKTRECMLAAAAGAADEGEGGGGEAVAATAQVADELARQKQVYREGFAELKALKMAIAGLQAQLEREAKGHAKSALQDAAVTAEAVATTAAAATATQQQGAAPPKTLAWLKQ